MLNKSQTSVQIEHDTAYINLDVVTLQSVAAIPDNIHSIVFENGVRQIKAGALINLSPERIAFSSTIELIEKGAINTSALKVIVVDRCDTEGRVHRHKLNCTEVFSIATIKDSTSANGASIYIDYKGETENND